MAKLKDSLFGQQDGTCACCGITVDGMFGVCFIDGNSDNQSDDNVAGVCLACEALHRGGRLNKVQTAGSLIYLPAISQSELIRFAWAMEYSLASGINNEVVSVAAKLRGKEFRMLENTAHKILGIEGVDDLTFILEEMSDEKYLKRGQGLGGIRWLPKVNSDQFGAAIAKISPSFISIDDLPSWNAP